MASEIEYVECFKRVCPPKGWSIEYIMANLDAVEVPSNHTHDGYELRHWLNATGEYGIIVMVRLKKQ